MSRPNRLGIPGVVFKPGYKSYPFIVKINKVQYGAFHTAKQAEQYANLVRLALAGYGEMPPPVKEYRKIHGLEVDAKWNGHEYVTGKPGRPATKPKPVILKPDPRRSCATCRWKGKVQGKKGGESICCNYSLVETHHTRLYLHYFRTGKQSMEGFTKDRNCIEWEPEPMK